MLRRTTFFVFACIIASLPCLAAQYYVAGDGSAGSPWCDGKNWVVNGSKMTMDAAGVKGTVTFSNVPVGSYQFKVTNGSNTWYGISMLSRTCSNLYTTGSDNLCFSLQDAQDVTITFDGAHICVTGSIGNAYPDTSLYGKYGVPAEYEGVMLQGFYWDSYRLTKYGRTQWADWMSMGYAASVGDAFDLVWLPPAGNGGGVGYYTKTYSNLTSDWGNRQALTTLIDTLHAHGCKVLADVVVNHRMSSQGWARAFTSENFGEYGTFQITSEHICSTDEAHTNSSSDSRSYTYGNADTGDNDGGCRDLDHTSTYVQSYIKAYAQWLLNTIGFDGFRYDMVKGYSGMYLSMYNQASDPFFSVAEYWDGTPANIRMYMESANFNTLAFDFPLKYKLNTWKGGTAYSNLVNSGMRGAGMQKYAVTFVDNHDTFERSDNQGDEFVGYNVSLTTNRQKILQANAYILMMPGVPCVFWPHWNTFSDDIKKMIAIRKQVGIHSESSVTAETAGSDSYSATITGHRGQAVLRMGSKRNTDVPSGFTLSYSGPGMDIYTKTTDTSVGEVTVVPAPVTKTIENGRLVIKKGEKTYDVFGTQF